MSMKSTPIARGRILTSPGAGGGASPGSTAIDPASP
jgi:hypothetical protein